MLRKYQVNLIDKLRLEMRKGTKRIVAVLPTGAGKTFTFTHIVKSAMTKGKKVVILTDRVELMKQAGGSLNVFGMDPVVLEAGSNPDLGAPLYTAMVETLYRRLNGKRKIVYNTWLKTIDLLIVDECHMRSFDKVFEHLSDKVVILGWTATPKRKGKENQLGMFYQKLVIGVEIEYLIDNGYLSEPNYYGVEADLSNIKMKRGDFDQNQVAEQFSKDQLYRGVSENLLKYAPNEKTLVFSSNIASSVELCNNLQEENFNARHLDSTMGKIDRERVLKWFKENDNAVLCNVGILTKGFDEPSIKTIVLYRATRSLPLYLQMTGRGSRVIENVKNKFNILDFGGNIARHGFWHDKQAWSLDLLPEREEGEGTMVLKQCKNKSCMAFIPVRTIECPFCGHIDEKEEEQQEFAMLEKLDPRELRNKASNASLQEKVTMAKQKLIKPYWVLHTVNSFEEAKNFVKGMGWNPWWMHKNYHRFWWSQDYLKARENKEVI